MGNVLSNALLGKQEAPTEYIDFSGIDTSSPEFLENTGGIVDVSISKNPKVGGLLPDIAAGYRENRTTPISLDNFGKNTLEDGRRKGFAYKLGEGLGSFARFADSPLGRGLLMAGIVGGAGGSGLQALAYGGGAGLLNQQSRMKDKMYRNELEKMGFDTTGINGYVGDDTFNKIFQSKQLQDNAEYRNALLKGQRLEQDALIAQKQAELQHKKVSEAADRALKSRELDIKEKQIGNKNTNIGNLQAVNSQLKRFEESFKNMPNKFESNTLGRLRAATGFQTENEANFNSQRQLLFNKIARDLGGEKGVLSDQDIKRIEGALPSYTDSMVQKQAKMQAIYDLLNDRLAVEGGSLDNTQTTTNADAIVNKLKQNGYSDAEISEYLRMKGY
jgi:hypothetical protein